MDQERYIREDRASRLALIREKKPSKAHLPDEKINYRLIQDWEVPQWIHASVVEEKKEDPLMSLGKRTRKEVNYKEQVSDSQYFKMIEAGLDPNSESDLKKARRTNFAANQASDEDAEKAQDTKDKKGGAPVNAESAAAIENHEDVIVSEGSENEENDAE